MGHSGAGSGCIGCCWKPSQPWAIMVNKLSWGLATETTHWWAPFFSTAGPLSVNTAALEYGLKWGLILIPEMALLRADQKEAERKLENDVSDDWLANVLTVCPCTDIGLLLKEHFSWKLTISSWVIHCDEHHVERFEKSALHYHATLIRLWPKQKQTWCSLWLITHVKQVFIYCFYTIWKLMTAWKIGEIPFNI